MVSLLEQFKQRRVKLGFKQHDMMLRIGMSRQQYQRLESKGNPRLDTLELIAKGLQSELMLIPQDKLQAVRDFLESDYTTLGNQRQLDSLEENELTNNPWRGLLGEDEDS